MTTKVTLRKVGGSLVATIPKEMTDQLALKEGDQLFATLTPDGIQLRPSDADFEAAMEAFEVGRRRYRNALRKLAQ